MASVGDAAAILAALQERSFARAGRATRNSFPPERRMDGYLLEQVLRTRSYLVVATTRGDGRPHATPSSFIWLDGKIWLPTEPHTRGPATSRLRRMRRWF
ncbi:MAG: pyridoxamine 5'-phosphate oxidase family protein [Actinobacteria bacterium]|nr:pyridoxamine 5'-phosphate oxidase family protein [Actinomycetota bacterium]